MVLNLTNIKIINDINKSNKLKPKSPKLKPKSPKVLLKLDRVKSIENFIKYQWAWTL